MTYMIRNLISIRALIRVSIASIRLFILVSRASNLLFIWVSTAVIWVANAETWFVKPAIAVKIWLRVWATFKTGKCSNRSVSSAAFLKCCAKAVGFGSTRTDRSGFILIARTQVGDLKLNAKEEERRKRNDPKKIKMELESKFLDCGVKTERDVWCHIFYVCLHFFHSRISYSFISQSIFVFVFGRFRYCSHQIDNPSTNSLIFSFIWLLVCLSACLLGRLPTYMGAWMFGYWSARPLVLGLPPNSPPPRVFTVPLQ